MNRFMCSGRLTRDPEIRYSNQTAIARFSLAVDRRYKKDGEPDADYFDCTAFGKTGEFVEKYVTKGMKIIAIGRIEDNNYTNRDGQKVYGKRFIVEEIEFCESKKADKPAQKQTEPKQPDTEWMNIADNVSEEELPFL